MSDKWLIHYIFFLMKRRPPRSTRMTHSFPTLRASDLDRLREAAAALRTSPDDVPARVVSLVEERRRLERELAEAKRQLALGGGVSKAEVDRKSTRLNSSH